MTPLVEHVIEQVERAVGSRADVSLHAGPG